MANAFAEPTLATGSTGSPSIAASTPCGVLGRIELVDRAPARIDIRRLDDIELALPSPRKRPDSSTGAGSTTAACTTSPETEKPELLLGT